MRYSADETGNIQKKQSFNNGGTILFYHASNIPNITRLEPRVSNHGVPLIYFSEKRENVLVYLSNAIEKYCKETGFEYNGKWQKWGPYGFDKNGVQCITEYYKNALESTYRGVSAYIYSVEAIETPGISVKIPFAATSGAPVDVAGVEYVPDAYEAILEAERHGLIRIERYDQLDEKTREWNRATIIKEYENVVDHPEYRHFIKGNFGDIIAD